MLQSVPGSKCYPCFKIRFPKYLSEFEEPQFFLEDFMSLYDQKF